MSHPDAHAVTIGLATKRGLAAEDDPDDEGVASIEARGSATGGATPSRADEALALRWSAKGWAKRLKSSISPWHVVPTPEAMLRSGLISGDLRQVFEALHPERVRPPLGCLSYGRAASLHYAYFDDAQQQGVGAGGSAAADAGEAVSLPARALDYLGQGSLCKHAAARRANASARQQMQRRSQASDERRAAVLRELFKDSAHAAALWAQLGTWDDGGAAGGSACGLGQALEESPPERTNIFHRCAASGSKLVLNSLLNAVDWRQWRMHWNKDVADADDSDYLPAWNLRKCRLHCLQRGYGGFVVVAGYAYFRKQPAAELANRLVFRANTAFHIAPGPSPELPPNSLAPLLLGKDREGNSPLDVSLRAGGETLRLVGPMGGLECGALRFEKRELEALDRALYGGLPQWLARLVGTLPQAGNAAPAGATSGVVLESAEDIRNQVLRDRDMVARSTGTSAAVAEALLRHFDHSPEAAIGAYRADPVAARAAAHLPQDDAAPAVSPAPECGICFTDLPDEGRGPPLRAFLPCGGGAHVFCDDCLRRHVEGRLEEGDIQGVVCPDPTCRLPIAEEAVAAMCGPSARARFVQIAASQAVDRAAHMTWCPRPGCGRAVARSEGLTVKCSCGFSFCSSCQVHGGHEPATCENWEAWQKEYPDPEARRRGNDDPDALRWMRRNTQRCPGCRAHVQRNQGCNHMVCRCGVHFCYICGRRWEEHRNQEGGMDYYRCRLTPQADSLQTVTPGTEFKGLGRDEDHIHRFDAMARSAHGVRQWVSEASGLWEALHGIVEGQVVDTHPEQVRRENVAALTQFLAQAAETASLARQTLQYSLVLAWAAHRAGQETGCLEAWFGELDATCGTLEAILGGTFTLAAAMAPTTEPHAEDAPRCACLMRRRAEGASVAWPLLAATDDHVDLRGAAARLQALDGRLSDAVQLRHAVERLRVRILAGARAGQCSGPPPGLLSQIGQRLLSWLGF